MEYYYSMKQGSAERVCEFAHRFHGVQNELIKLIPNIHLIPDGSDVELRHAFTIKLRTEIQREIVSRDFTYSSLQEIVQVAERFEKIHPPTTSEWSTVQLRPCPSMLTKHAKQRHFRHVAFARKPTI